MKATLGMDDDGVVHEVTQTWANGVVRTQCQQYWNRTSIDNPLVLLYAPVHHGCIVTCLGCLGTMEPNAAPVSYPV